MSVVVAKHEIRHSLDFLPASQCRIAAQPIVSLRGDGGTSVTDWFELLVRPCGSMRQFSPEAFVSRAYNGPLGLGFDRHMVSIGCHWAARNDGMRVSININPLSLGDELFVRFVLDTLDDNGLNADQLCLEVVENIHPGPIAKLVAGARRLTRVGVLLALDDFGQGPEAMSLFDALPVKIIKVDRRHVVSLSAQHTSSRALVGIKAMADAVGANVVAEGIETIEQLRALESMNIEYGQGFVLGRPEALDL